MSPFPPPPPPTHAHAATVGISILSHPSQGGGGRGRAHLTKVQRKNEAIGKKRIKNVFMMVLLFNAGKLQICPCLPPLPPPTHYSQWWRFNTQPCTIGGGGRGRAKIRDQGIPKAFKHEGYSIFSLNCWSLPALLCNRHMYERLYNSLLHILCNNKMQTWILIVYIL
jgi:hypothetical protein